jgi:hypothetical protein
MTAFQIQMIKRIRGERVAGAALTMWYLLAATLLHLASEEVFFLLSWGYAHELLWYVVLGIGFVASVLLQLFRRDFIRQLAVTIALLTAYTAVLRITHLSLLAIFYRGDFPIANFMLPGILAVAAYGVVWWASGRSYVRVHLTFALPAAALVAFYFIEYMLLFQDH